MIDSQILVGQMRNKPINNLLTVVILYFVYYISSFKGIIKGFINNLLFAFDKVQQANLY